MDYEQAKKLLFHNVDVITNVRKAQDFVGSIFVQPDQGSKTKEQPLLTYTGYLKVIDPISKSVILCKTLGNTVTGNILILGHSICDIRESKRDPYNDQSQVVLTPAVIECMIETDSRIRLANHPYFFRPNTGNSLTQEELQERQSSIISWFRKFFIPIELNSHTQELIIAESVRIRPPYEHESDYISPTRVALKRIKHIVDSRQR